MAADATKGKKAAKAAKTPASPSGTTDTKGDAPDAGAAATTGGAAAATAAGGVNKMYVVGGIVGVLAVALLFGGKAGPKAPPVFVMQGPNPTVGSEFAVEAVGTSGSAPKQLGMEWLLHPMKMDEFYRERWETKPTFVHRDDPAYYSRLNSSLAEMEKILFIQKTAQRDKFLMHPEGTGSQAGCSWVREGMEDRSREYRDVFEAYLDGCTVVCHIIPAYWPPLATLMRELERETKLVYMTNLYLTPRDSQGFTEHTDNKDGFIAQIEGYKHWVMKKSAFQLPNRQQTVGRPHQQPASTVVGETIFDGILSPGDLLVVPRGSIHYAESVEASPSMHFTISAVKNLEWNDYLLAFIKNYPLEEISPRVGVFFTEVFPGAINAAAAAPENGWLRAALPLSHRSATTHDEVHKAMDVVIGKLHTTLSERLKEELETQPVGKQAFEDAFAALLQTPQDVRDVIFEKVLTENDIFYEYVHRLVDRGLSQKFDFEDALLTADSVFKREVTERIIRQRAGDRIHLRWADKVMNLRRTPSMEAMVKTITALPPQGTVRISSFETNDVFEVVCFLRVAIRTGLLTLQ